MTNEITDMKNTAIRLEGLDKGTIRAYIKICERYLGRKITINGDYYNMPYLELSPVWDGCLSLYATNLLEDTTKLVTLEKTTIYKVVPVERKTVTLFGTEYYEDMLTPMLDAMEKAKVT